MKRIEGSTFAALSVVAVLGLALTTAAEELSFDGKQTWNSAPSIEGWQGSGLTNPGIDGNGYLLGGYLGIRTSDYPNGSVWHTGLPTSYAGDWGAMFGTTGAIEWDMKIWSGNNATPDGFGFDGTNTAYSSTTTSYFNLYMANYTGWRYAIPGQGPAAGVVHHSIPFDATWTDAQAAAAGWVDSEYGGASWATTVANVATNVQTGFKFYAAGYSMHLAIDNFVPGPVAAPPPPPTPGEWSVGTPIVKYFGGARLTDTVVQQAVAGGFNVVGASSMNELNLAQQYGLRAHWLGGRDDETIIGIRNHPALYSYELIDEPSAAQFGSLGATVQHVRDLDPHHMVYINLFPTYASNAQLGTSGDTFTAYNSYLSQYISTVQPSLISYDHYHFFQQSGQPIDRSQYFLNLKLVAEASQQAELPFMNVVQAYAVTGSSRVPNANELRFLSYTSLAYGAQGINYFRYDDAIKPNPDGTPTSTYTALQSINPQFVAIATQVQPLQWIGAYHLGDQPPGTERLPANSPFTLTPNVSDTSYVDGKPVKGMLLGLFGPDAELADAQYALVVNLDYKNSTTITVIGPENLSIFDATTGLWSPTGSNQALLNLLPGGGAMVRFASIPEPASLTLALAGFAGMIGRNLRRRRRAPVIHTKGTAEFTTPATAKIEGGLPATILKRAGDVIWAEWPTAMTPSAWTTGAARPAQCVL